MALDKNSLRKLRSELPKGFGPILKERLLVNRKLTFSLQYIYQTFDENDNRYNQDIIDEAILLLAVVKEKDKADKALINSLIKS
jgi:hypothetical protein